MTTSARAVISEMATLGVRLEVVDGRLRPNGPTKTIPPELAQRARELRHEIACVLRGESSAQSSDPAPGKPNHPSPGNADACESEQGPSGYDLIPVPDLAAWRPLNGQGTAHEHIATGWPSTNLTVPRRYLEDLALARRELRPMAARSHAESAAAQPSPAPRGPVHIAYVARPKRYDLPPVTGRPRVCCACGAKSDSNLPMPDGWAVHAVPTGELVRTCSAACRKARVLRGPRKESAR